MESDGEVVRTLKQKTEIFFVSSPLKSILPVLIRIGKEVSAFTNSFQMVQALLVRYSVYSILLGQPVRSSLDNASNTMINGRGFRKVS